ncbi:MAG: DUF2283 domain-containing protein [Blastocatellia bacterium]|nr:DUF2283 domain-containing protein [Blastocatellia bacterium]
MRKETHTSHEIQIENGDIAYIRMPNTRPELDRKVAKSIMLRDLLREYKGFDVVLDISEDDELLGIEILAF